MSDFDVSAHNFMMNTLNARGSGGGATGAGGSPLALKISEGFGAEKPLFGFEGIDKAEKKVQPAALVTVAKFFEGTQGMAQSVSMQSVALFQVLQPPKPTPNMPEIKKALFSPGKGSK